MGTFTADGQKQAPFLQPRCDYRRQRLERLEHGDDPYLETRAKEDAFLKQVWDAIEQGMKNAAPLNLLSLLQGSIQSNEPQETVSETSAEEMDAAMDFIDSF